MSAQSPRRLHVTLLVAVVSLSMGCVGTSNRIAETVLANEVRFDDREPPQSPQSLAASADAVQHLGGQGRGLSCSLPRFAQTLAFAKGADQAPIALQMRQACAYHDYCYRHGNATYGYSQADCDFTLQQQAFRLCKFINQSASINDCETDARKVTIGVRLGGSGSFKRVRALDDDKASTFHEFDSYPVRATSYRVVRIADAPRQWVRDGLLPKAAYHFDVRPSGSLVAILGWKPNGAMVCTSFLLPASYNAINGPPMVARDGNGEDWFVWWKRAGMSTTGGSFALLPPGRAAPADWVAAAGGWTGHGNTGDCEEKSAWRASSAGALPGPLLAFVTPPRDLNFSEIHPVIGAGTPGFVRMFGLSTHSCVDADLSPCLVDVEFDTVQRDFRKQPASPTLYRAMDPNCRRMAATGSPQDSCDRYRNYVGAPYVTVFGGQPALTWTRRGTGNGGGYEATATVRRFTVGRSREEPGVDMGELRLENFSEAMEPAFLTHSATATPIFVSVVAGAEQFRMVAQPATAKGDAVAVAFDCFRHPDNSWLLRPPALVPDPHHAGRNYIVFSRVRMGGPARQANTPAATLDVAVVTLADDACLGMRELSFASFFDGFLAPDELAPGAPALDKRGSGPDEELLESFGRFAERVRGGQMVLADVTGDGVPDLVQVARIAKTQNMRTAILAGSLDGTGLTFHALQASTP
jgi:hypothetical protein